MCHAGPFRKVVAVVSTSTLNSTASAVNEDGLSRPEREALTLLLLKEASEAGHTEREALHERVIRLNMPVATSLAHRYRGRGVALDDLMQVAYLGLVKAVRGFAPDRGAGFLGYAVPTIRGEIRRYFRDAGWAVRPPRRVQELQARVWAAEAALVTLLQRSPTVSEVTEFLGVSLDEVNEALAADGCFIPSSLDAGRRDGEGESLADRQGDLDPGFESCEARLVLAPALRSLAERDRRIVELRFVRGWTQQRIGEEVGVTQMQVSRLLDRILEQLRVSISGQVA